MPIGTTPARAHTLEQTSVGFDHLNRQLLRLEPDSTAILVVMEATGTYWMRLALALCDTHIAVAVVNPAPAHDFAKALRKRSKTDAIDAQTLAAFAARLQPHPWTPPPPVQNEVQQRLVHRDARVDAHPLPQPTPCAPSAARYHRERTNAAASTDCYPE